MTDDVVATIITEQSELAGLRGDWLSLWERCPTATTFQHPDWLIAWWRIFHPGALRIVVARAGDDLVALAPLYLETGDHGSRLLPIGISLSDNGDVLIAPGQEARVLPAIAGRLCSGPSDWTRLDWDDLASDAAALMFRSSELLAATTDEVGAPCPVLKLPPSLELLNTVVPAGKMRKLRMARHRGARRGAILQRHTPDDCDIFLDALERLHSARWRSRGEPGVFGEDRPAAFLRKAAPALLRGGYAVATTLVLDGTVAAAFLGFQRGEVVSAYMGGFDPAYAFESPGVVLLGDAIEQAIQAGAREFSFLRGAEPYKYEWGAVDRFNRRLSLVRNAAAYAA